MLRCSPEQLAHTFLPLQPLVSVIIPFYNAHEWFHETLASLTVQTLQDFEVIVVNDASTDHDSLKALHHLEAKFAEFRVAGVYYRLLTHSRNRGLSGSRNTGVKYGLAALSIFLGNTCALITFHVQLEATTSYFWIQTTG